MSIYIAINCKILIKYMSKPVDYVVCYNIYVYLIEFVENSNSVSLYSTYFYVNYLIQ